MPDPKLQPEGHVGFPGFTLFVWLGIESEKGSSEGFGAAAEMAGDVSAFDPVHGASDECVDLLKEGCKSFVGAAIELGSSRQPRDQLRQLVSGHAGDGTQPGQSAAHGLAEAAVIDAVERALLDAIEQASRLDGVTRSQGRKDAAHGPALDECYASIAEAVEGYVSYPEAEIPTYRGNGPNVYPELEQMRALGLNGTKGHLLERQALAYGLATVRFSKGAFLAYRDGLEPLNFRWSRSPISSGTSLSLCTHKEATRAQLRRHGVPVPKGRTFKRGDFQAAKDYATQIGFPVVCKPATGVRGIGVVANIQDPQDLERAFTAYQESELGDDDFIIEQHIDGGDYRIVVVEDQVVAAIIREPASVTGDGYRSVGEIIAAKNASRRFNPHLWARPIKAQATAKYHLQRQGLTLTSIPEHGRRVRLASSCSLSQGGDSIDVLDEMHPSIIESAIRAVRAVPGLRYCGVDYLLEDHRKPLEQQRAAGVCELNAHAAIGNGEYPMFGTPRKVAEQLLVRCARRYGYRLDDAPAETLSLRLEVRGVVTRVGYRTWLKQRAENYGLIGSVRNVAPKLVEATLRGPTLPVTALVSLAIQGPRSSSPTSIRTFHVEEAHFDGLTGFEILD